MNINLPLKHILSYLILTVFLLIQTSCDNSSMGEQQMLENAKSYLKKNELIAASIELRNTLKINNKNAEARYLLGTINLKAGDLTSAEKEFRSAELAGWNKEDTQTGLAIVFIAQKEFQKLLDQIKIIGDWPPSTRANISGLRALAEASLGLIPDAKATLEAGRSYSDNAFHILKTTAMFQLSGILDGDASKTLKHALSRYPDNIELLLLSASNDISNNHITTAADTYRKVITLEPSNLLTPSGRSARIGLARLQIIGNQYDEVDATLAPVLKRNSKDPEANYLTALLAFSQGNYSRAEDHARILLSIIPDNPLFLQLMGKIEYALHDYEQATHHLTAYLNANPDDIDNHKLLANTYLMLKQPEKAMTALQPVLTFKSDDSEAQTILSQIEFSQGNIDAGILALKRAISSNPDSATLHKKLAMAYISIGQTNNALLEIETFQNISNDADEAQKLIINAYMQSGDIDKAIHIADNMLLKEPDNPEILSLNGTLQSIINNGQQARIYYNKALLLHSNLPSATIGLARLESSDGNLEKAMELYKGLVDSNVGGTLPMLALAELAAKQNHKDDMLLWLERTRSTDPHETRSRIILANYYLRNKQPEQARIYIQEAIRTSPEQNELLALQGKTLLSLKRYSEAQIPLNKLADKSPASADAQLMLGEALLRQGLHDSAREHLQKALYLENDNYLALSLLAETEFISGNYDKSLHYTKSLQKSHPELYIGYMQEGDILMIKKDYKNAMAAYNSAWRQQQTAELALRLYSASRNIVTFNESIKPLLTWLSDHPNDSATRLYLASSYQSADRDQDAILEYEKVLEITPENSQALNNLAWLYFQKGNPKALDLAERAYRSAPDNPGILDTYGWILIQSDQVMKGQRLIMQAMESLPDNLDIRYHYAVSLIKSGKDVQGREILEELYSQNKPFDGRDDTRRLLEK